MRNLAAKYNHPAVQKQNCKQVVVIGHTKRTADNFRHSMQMFFICQDQPVSAS